MDHSRLPSDRHTMLERGVRYLRRSILRGDLQPGEQLKQQELAERLGMSSTPVREVLRILESEGLLERIPYKGVYVAEVSPQGVEEATPIRAALEGLAVRLAVPLLTEQEIEKLERLDRSMTESLAQLDFVQVRKLNYDFHIALYRASGSIVLLNMIERLWPRFATNMLWMIPGRAERSIQQHHEIVKAIRERDPERASTLIAEHIYTAGQSIIDFLNDRQGTELPASSLRLDIEP